MSGAPPVAADPVLAAHGLEIAYGDNVALRGVDLGFARGEITAIIGPSGCGKSSLLASLNRLTDLVPGCRVGGRITLDGQDLHAPGYDLIALRRRIGMIFQKPNPFPMSIRRNLDLPLREHGMARRERRDAIERVLREVGLWEEVAQRLDAPALALSGGQQQRLCLARALVLAPEILLMDEPCSALDPVASARVERLIAGLRGRYTVVVVTHNLAQARRIADTTALLWLRDGVGHLVERGPTERLFTVPTDPLTAAYVQGRSG